MEQELKGLTLEEATSLGVAAEGEPSAEAPAGKPISHKASQLIDFIERAHWNIEVCKADAVHYDVKLGYHQKYGEAADATEDDKAELARCLTEIEDNKKKQAEQERFLAYCNEALEKQKALDEAAA